MHLYLTDANFHDMVSKHPNDIAQTRIRFAEDEAIASVSTDPDKWPEFIDKMLVLIKDASTGYKNLHKEVIAQLCHNKDKLFEDTLKHEIDAHDQNKYLFWRSSKEGHKTDIESSSEHKSSLKSFGDSLLAGYIKDGVLYSNISEGIGNYSACVLSYYTIHEQALEAKEKGEIDGISISKLPENYQNYINNLDKYETYTLKLTVEEIMQLEQEGKMIVPDCTISSAVCFQSGEEFHPRINLTGVSEDSVDIIF